MSGSPQEIDVLVSEVGPRDGLQSVKRTMPTEAKNRWIHASGGGRPCARSRSARSCRRKLLPQMADAAAVVREALNIPGLRVAVLVPNLRDAQMALEAGAHKMTIPVSVSEPHSLSNIRMNHDEIIAQVRAIVKLRNELLSRHRESRLGCRPRSDARSRARCPRTTGCGWPAAMVACGADIRAVVRHRRLANPAQIKRLFTRRAPRSATRRAARICTTRAGRASPTWSRRLRSACTTFDSSQAGIGGCPYAPGATGNIVTEDLVFLLESMGLAPASISTG